MEEIIDFGGEDLIFETWVSWKLWKLQAKTCIIDANLRGKVLVWDVYRYENSGSKKFE